MIYHDNTSRMIKHLMKRKAQILLAIFLAFTAIFVLSGFTSQIDNEKSYVRLLFLKYKVNEFAQKYKGQNVIIVSKQDHLLFYVKDGEVVKNEQWNGFNYTFPVKVALASQYYKTPEGEFKVEVKNDRSQFIKFLGFKGLYGIHSAPTRYKGYLKQMEAKNPDFEFATKVDNTRGCVQIENRVIQYLYANVEVDTPVIIMP